MQTPTVSHFSRGINIEAQMVQDGSYNIRLRQDGGPITVYHLIRDGIGLGTFAKKKEAKKACWAIHTAIKNGTDAQPWAIRASKTPMTFFEALECNQQYLTAIGFNPHE